jgi:phosphonate transport system substrate-binding protein
LSRSLLCVLALSLLLVSVASAADSGPERSFAVVPQLSPTRLVQQWQPLLNLLEARTGIRFHFVTAPTIAEFEQRVLAGKYDYVYMSAALGRDAHRSGTYRLLVRRRPDLHAIIVVRRDGPHSLEQLRNKVIAYPAPYAYGATQLNRAHLRKLHIQYRVAFLGSHESVYRAVAQGQFLAGGGIDRSFNLLPNKVRDQLRILYRTPAAPSHEIAARSRLSRTETRRVKSVLLGLGHDARNRKLLAALDIDGFRRGTAEDQARLRASGVVRHPRPAKVDFLVIPRLSHDDTVRQMEPLAVYLKQRLEIDVSLKTFDDMASFDRAIHQERGPALVNANPLQAIRLAHRGYTIIAQQLPVNSPRGMYSVILVRHDSPIHSLADLRGKRVAFGGGPDAFFASVVPHVILQRAGLRGAYIDASKPGPVSDVIARLRNGDIDAAGTGAMALYSEGLKKRYAIDKMRVLARGEPMPGLAWLLSPQVGPELRSEIRRLLLGYEPTDPGHAALIAAGIAGMSPASRKDYALVEKYMRELKTR